MDSTATKVTKICMIAFACLGAFLSIFYVYVTLTYTDTTHGTTYASTLEPKNVEDRPYFMEINLMENKNGNGIELQEIKFTRYTDWAMQDVYVTGMQHIGNYNSQEAMIIKSTGLINVSNDRTTTLKSMDDKVGRDFYWYDGYDGESWASLGTGLKHDTELRFSSNNGDLLSATLNRENTYKSTGSPFGILYSGTVTYVQNYGTLFEAVMKAVKSMSYGYGSYVMPLDLAPFFTIRVHDGNGVFKKQHATNENFFVEVKVNHEPNGAVISTQSILKCIMYKPNYGMENLSGYEFWKYGVQYLVTENDFNLRYSASYNGYFLSLKDNVKNYLQNTERLITDVVIDLNKFNNVIGLDFHCFYQTQLRGLTIFGAGNFYLLDYSLYGSELQTLKHSNGVNLITSPFAVNNTFTEVLI